MKQFNIDGVVKYLHISEGEKDGVYVVVMERLAGKVYMLTV